MHKSTLHSKGPGWAQTWLKQFSDRWHWRKLALTRTRDPNRPTGGILTAITVNFRYLP